jgi:hypothetical protein
MVAMSRTDKKSQFRITGPRDRVVKTNIFSIRFDAYVTYLKQVHFLSASCQTPLVADGSVSSSPNTREKAVAHQNHIDWPFGMLRE